ncbi:MAG: PAS domain S-box protein [Gorillibacterium sp.]|nr:PAS domain S-box protein [Gorillibacterium sp.]
MAADYCKNQRQSPDPAQCMEHYSCIYENNHLITLLVDPKDGGIVDANRAACLFYGYPLNIFKKLCISDLSAENDGRARDFIGQALPEGEFSGNRVIIQRHRQAGGQIIDVEIHTGILAMLGKNCIYSVVHDISERVRAENQLKGSEERYRGLVELCPEAILVLGAGTILFANKQSEKIFGKGKQEIIGRSVDTFFHEPYINGEEANTLTIENSTQERFSIERRLIRFDGLVFDLELSGAPIVYEEKKAQQLIIRNMTESKKEIKRAVKLQETRHAVAFPLESKAVMEKLYVPAATLSGDFFIFQQIDEMRVIGIIGDVTGKGISAALNISALRVLIAECLLITREPVAVLRDLNQKAMQHLGEDYVAVCCFSLDFAAGRLTAAGGGINEFMYVPKVGECERITVKGAPLGMFDSSEFEDVSIAFNAEDRFCFYSDGMELLFDSAELCRDSAYLMDKIARNVLRDDCTWLSLRIK